MTIESSKLVNLKICPGKLILLISGLMSLIWIKVRTIYIEMQQQGINIQDIRL